MLVGAETEDQVFKPIEGKRLSQTIVITTEDGSLGETGSVVDHLPDAVVSTGAQVIYAAGRRSTLRRIAEFCAERQIPSQIAVEEEMACGIGLCFSCAVPVIRKDGSGYDNLRACIDGPVFNPARILWDRWLGEERLPAATPPEGFPVVKVWPG
jgi:dihydroorotate dehydrogenase electron transfer subunit